jgi:hypothetical protein
MTRPAAEAEPVSCLPRNSADNAHRDPFLLQRRALLDMGFDVAEQAGRIEPRLAEACGLAAEWPRPS